MKIKQKIFAFGLFWLVFLGGLLTTRVISKDFSINRVKMISDMPSIRDSVGQHQKDARYVPYKARLLIFNNSVYFYQILRNVANFLNLDNLNKIMLWGNFYPFILGLVVLWQKRKDKFWICISGLSGGCLAIGLNKMVDARAATWFMLPILSYLVIKGLKRINLKIYVPILITSVILLI